jgi:leucyl-tRNA synthetase
MMAEYNFNEIEKKWQKFWKQNQTFKTDNQSSKPKYYVLDMFPYPSGAGLHVGHPLGYIASDIVARFKRNQGFNVLHPMGFDAFGLPAEQYAIQTGQHPAITTENNIAKYKEQLDNIGFSFDWNREERTSEPSYYKWTQWIFIQLFNSWYDKSADKAAKIEDLIAIFSKEGNASVNAHTDFEGTFTAEEWNSWDEEAKQKMLLNYRMAYIANTTVNWCAALGTVLANEEVKDGVSERGGYPVEKKEMQQWSLRITAYANRLIEDIDALDWTDSVKEMQKNWIGRSFGSTLRFKLENSEDIIEVFTTRPDTTFGVQFVTLSPEHKLVSKITTPEQKDKVEKYAFWAKNRSERDRISDTDKTGEFTGAYVINPFNNQKVPVWISDYVLAGYGTGAVMAVPSSDIRDYEFATKFNLPIVPVLTGEGSDITQEDFDPKKGTITMINSGFLNGLSVKDAITKAIEHIEANGWGKGKINFRIRDAIFTRQRYWGEPIPVYFKNGLPYVMKESELPLTLPEIDAYQPTETGEPPLGRAKDWKYENQYQYELSTMPGWAGSSWYYLRYMDAHNDHAFVSKDAEAYWQNVDLYIGGAEHATGHLLYSRFWNKFLFDIGVVTNKEPFKKLVNQGMIQGRSNLICKVKDTNVVVCKNKLKAYAEANNLNIAKDFIWLYVDVNLVDAKDHIKVEDIKKSRLDLRETVFEFSTDEEGNELILCDVLIEKMSKSKFNVVNPDNIVEKYGADTLRLYEMFLGPLEQFKPWNTNSIDGVARFLRKVWRLFYDEANNFAVSDEPATDAELKILHRTIKKVEEDIERLSFNTSVSTFMICVNELATLKSNKRAILEPFLVMLSSYAPHIAEELWEKLGHTESISFAPFPKFEEKYLVESAFEYPISLNGKVRHKMSFALDMPTEDIEKEVLASEIVQKWLEGATPKKMIVVKGRIVNVVY